MHTSTILRSHHFRIVDEAAEPCDVVAGLTAQDRLGIVSPRYEDGILGASAAILAFITAFYDIQRARQQETGEPFFIYADYFAFLFGDAAGVRGRIAPAPLASGIGEAYGQLDVWPDDKWVVAGNAGDLWAQVRARDITHLLLPLHPAGEIGPIPDVVAAGLKATYRYLMPDERPTGGRVIRIELTAEPLGVIAESISRLPAESPAHGAPLAAYQLLTT